MNEKYSNIRCVAFDYGGVLAHFIDTQGIRAMADVAQADYALFNASMWKYRQELDSGEYGSNQYWTMVLDHCNSQSPRESVIGLLAEMDLDGFSRMNQDMVSWAETLKKHGIGTIIISNMSEPTFQRLIAHKAWMRHFDAAVISGILGINKPDRRIFDHARECVQLKAGEMLFLDDLAHNVYGAKEAGLQAMQFSNTQTLAKDIQVNYPALPLGALGSS